MEQKIIQILDELMIRYPILGMQRQDIWKAYELMAETFEAGKKLLVAGNGGSAADAEHIVGELMKGFVKPRNLKPEILEKFEEVGGKAGKEIGEKIQGALPAIAVVNHVALSTAYLNDVDPLLSFSQQVYGYGEEGDVFWGISTSGNSKNILSACTVAHARGMKVIGLTGGSGGRLKEEADVVIAVPGEETFKIQELHLPVYHTLCLMLEEHFF